LAGADLLQPVRPVRLPEQIIVEQEDVPGPGCATPDVGNRGNRLDPASFPGHHAEGAVQAATPLRKTNTMGIPWIERILQRSRLRNTYLSQRHRDFPSGPAQDGVGVEGAELLAQGTRASKEQRAVDMRGLIPQEPSGGPPAQFHRIAQGTVMGRK